MTMDTFLWGYHSKCSDSYESCFVYFHHSKTTEEAIELLYPRQILNNYVNQCNLLELIT